MNLLRVEMRDGDARLGASRVALARRDVPDGAAMLGLRPGALQLAQSGVPAKVELVENLGETSIVDLQIADQPAKLRTEGRVVAHEGEQVFVAFDPAAAQVFDAATGLRIDPPPAQTASQL
jgi:ABC-type sugar transport system ATPase subunit